MPLIKWRDVDLSKFLPSRINRLDSGAIHVYFSYEGRDLLVQTPTRMQVPFPLSDYNGDGRYRLGLRFQKAMEGDAEEAAFQNWLENDVREHIQAQFVQNNWINESDATKLDMISNVNYNSVVKANKNKQYAPTLQTKVRNGKDGELVVDVFDHNKRPQTVAYLDSKCEASAAIRFNGVWIVNKDFGLLQQLHSIKVYRDDDLSSEGCVIDDGEDGEDGEGGEGEVSAPDASSNIASASGPPLKKQRTLANDEDF